MGNQLFCPKRQQKQYEFREEELETTSQKIKKGKKQTKGKKDKQSVKVQKEKQTTLGEYSLENDLSISLKLKQNDIVMNKENKQVIPGMLSIVAKDFNSEKIQNDEVNYQPLDLIFVIDQSGSMSGEKIELVKRSVYQILEFMKPTDKVCIIGFNSSARVYQELISVSQQNLKQIKQEVKALVAGGGTSIASGMQLAFNIIKQRKIKNELTSVFLLSDGQDSQGYSQTKEMLNSSNIKETFGIDSFGFGSDHDSKMLSSISNLKQGTFNFIRDIKQIDDAFAIIYGGIKSYIAQDITISVQFGNTEIMNGVSIQKTYGEEWIKKQDNKYEIKLLHLMAGRSKDFVFEMAIPPFEMGLSDQMRYQTIGLATIKAKCLNTKQNITKTAQLTVELFNSSFFTKKIKEDANVMQNYLRVLAADAMEQGNQFAAKGQFEKSQQVLQGVIDTINSSEYKKNKVVAELVSDLKNCQKACQQNNYRTFGQGYVMNAQQVNMNQYVACNYDSQFGNQAYIGLQCNGGQERFRTIVSRNQQNYV